MQEGIDAVRNILNRCWFDEVKCEKGIRALDNYRKEWNETLGTWRDHPRHDHFSNGCFIGDTLIDCMGGTKKIRDIKSGDIVCTPNGYKKVIQTFVYDANDLLEVTTTSNKFVCTPNHKIFTENGLIYADALRYDTILYNNKKWSKKSCRMLYGSRREREDIGFRENFIFQKMKRASFTSVKNTNGQDFTTGICIGMCGEIILERFPINIISIIKTGIQEIIILKIFNACPNPFTCHMQPKEINGLEARKTNNSLSEPKKKQSYGMQVKRAENGTLSMVNKLGRTERQFLRNAYNVVRNMRLGFLTQNIVITIVKVLQGVGRQLIMKIGNVRFVRNILSLTNMLKQERVVKIVQLRLQDAQKVYDFEVEDDHCYYANGILVSNSDAMRYLAISRKKARTKEDDEAEYRAQMRAYHEPDHAPLFSFGGGGYRMIFVFVLFNGHLMYDSIKT